MSCVAGVGDFTDGGVHGGETVTSAHGVARVHLPTESRLLLGTGMEDFFADSFTLSRLSRTFHNDDAGLTHVHGGPQDRCPNPPGANFSTCATGFNTDPPERFSAYRIFDKDPLVFDDRLELTVRYLPPGKCSLAPSRPDAGAGEGAGGGAAGRAAGEVARRTRFDAYAWFYTYER